MYKVIRDWLSAPSHAHCFLPWLGVWKSSSMICKPTLDFGCLQTLGDDLKTKVSFQINGNIVIVSISSAK